MPTMSDEGDTEVAPAAAPTERSLDLEAIASSPRVQYAVSFVVAVVAVGLALRPWAYAHDYVFTSGTDWVWHRRR